ncbi:MAG: hypothetical protein JW741_08010, partial [Sedimentisphaerales bacterium]|nr:hypothetical protein [Sedimentisphaerales bacterium]
GRSVRTTRICRYIRAAVASLEDGEVGLVDVGVEVEVSQPGACEMPVSDRATASGGCSSRGWTSPRRGVFKRIRTS